MSMGKTLDRILGYKTNETTTPTGFPKPSLLTISKYGKQQPQPIASDIVAKMDSQC